MELMHECSPPTREHGKSEIEIGQRNRRSIDEQIGEQKQWQWLEVKRVYKKKMNSRLPNYSSDLPSLRGRYFPKHWMNYFMNLTSTIIHPNLNYNPSTIPWRERAVQARPKHSYCIFLTELCWVSACLVGTLYSTLCFMSWMVSGFYFGPNCSIYMLTPYVAAYYFERIIPNCKLLIIIYSHAWLWFTCVYYLSLLYMTPVQSY